jgi:hypothetical protein
MSSTPAAERTPRQDDAGCLGGCLLLIIGPVFGLATMELASEIIGNAWSYCMDLAWAPAFDITDSPRFSLFETGGLFLALDSCCFPVGFWLAWRFLAARRRWIRAAAGCLAGLLLLCGAFATDLMLNVGPKHGMYIHARCPAGRPPSWPKWLPLRTSKSPVDFKNQG